MPAADRRRHHQPHPHGGEDRAGLPARLDRLCARRLARGGRGLRPAVAESSGRSSWPQTRGRVRRRCASSYGRGQRPSRAPAWPRRAPTASRIDWTGLHAAASPRFIGVARLRRLRPAPSSPRYIDWTPFFPAWELVGRYPEILEDDVVGEAARALYADAQAMLDRIIAEKLAQGRAASSASGRPTPTATTSWSSTDETPHHRARPPAHPAPADGQGRGPSPTGAGRLRRARSGPSPTGSAASRSPPATASASSPRAFKAEGDDYSAILAKALADRLAEAFAEALHQRVRTRALGLCARRGRRPSRT